MTQLPRHTHPLADNPAITSRVKKLIRRMPRLKGARPIAPPGRGCQALDLAVVVDQRFCPPLTRQRFGPPPPAAEGGHGRDAEVAEEAVGCAGAGDGRPLDVCVPTHACT